MNYLLVENTNYKEDALLYAIADFLWNHGNKVFFSSSYIDQQHRLHDYDYIISLVYEDCSASALIKKKAEMLCKYVDFVKSASFS